MKLDSKGRCCGRKPIVYKTPPAHKFCHRCCRAFNSETGDQIENWAWKQMPSLEFEQRQSHTKGKL